MMDSSISRQQNAQDSSRFRRYSRHVSLPLLLPDPQLLSSISQSFRLTFFDVPSPVHVSSMCTVQRRIGDIQCIHERAENSY